MKLFKRSPIIYNLIIYLIFSYLYLFVLKSLNVGESSFAVERLISFFKSNVYLDALLVTAIFFVFKVRRWSKVFIAAFLFLVHYQEAVVFFYKFDKIILTLSSLHILISFYYFLLWDMELFDVVYCPGFSKHDCGRKYIYDFETEAELDNGIILPIKLTNWDKWGVFCLVNESDARIKKKVLIRVKFENETFEQFGKIITSYGKGYGIKFTKEKGQKSNWGWREFYTIIRDRGYTPDFIKA